MEGLTVLRAVPGIDEPVQDTTVVTISTQMAETESVFPDILGIHRNKKSLCTKGFFGNGF